ncbi:MAG: hypothetical protein ACTTH5_07680 [Wolinella sp.]
MLRFFTQHCLTTFRAKYNQLNPKQGKAQMLTQESRLDSPCQELLN